MNRNTRIVNQSAVPVSSPEKFEGRQFVTPYLFALIVAFEVGVIVKGDFDL